MARPTECPVCRSEHTQAPDCASGAGGWKVNCGVCGEYIVSEEAWEDFLDPSRADAAWWTQSRRAALSHALNSRADLPVHPRHTQWILLTDAAMEAFKRSGAYLPTPPEQARNLIRIVGDHVRETGTPLDSLPENFYARIGARDPEAAAQLAGELHQRGVLNGHFIRGMQAFSIGDVNLTLNGWDTWEKIRDGRKSTGPGVIAMKFGDPTLDALVETVIKPAIASIEGLSVHRIDDPEIARAGVIDNVMRETLRDAGFLIADLSHANNGAYWEAGFVEGQDKPVIYLCERSKWKEERTHFDTNHCTTIVWAAGEEKTLARQLIATLRNSLRYLERR